MVYVSVYRKKNRISYGKEQQVVKYTPKVPGSYIYIYIINLQIYIYIYAHYMYLQTHVKTHVHTAYTLFITSSLLYAQVSTRNSEP